MKPPPVKWVVSALAALVLVGASACNRTPERTDSPEPEPAPAAEAKSAPSVESAPEPVGAKASAKNPGIEWKEPEGWTKIPQRSPMRLATYRVPRQGDDSEDAELAIFYFGSNSGGGVDANMKRWAGQFSDVPPADVRRSERTANDLTQHIMEIEKGTFSPGMMGPSKSKPNQGMLAAIVESPTGHYFFKLTGPAGTVKGSRAEFFKLLDGVRATDR